MELKYRVLSGVLLAVIVALIGFAPDLMAQYPQYAVIIAVLIAVGREVIKELGQQAQEPEQPVQPAPEEGA